MATPAVQKILALPPSERHVIYAQLNTAERVALDRALNELIENPWVVYANDPVGFVEQGLKETVWSKQREILESVRDNKRTAVPACHAPGKSHIAARIVAWWVSVHPVGTAQVITTATTFRQVRNIMWQNIRRVANQHDLRGEVTQVEWKINNEIVAYGFSSGNDEASVQGVHAPNLLVVVDEAGGIPTQLGQALEALMTGGHTRLLLLGNPATDQEDSWFERCCHSSLFNVLPISAFDTPAFTGEDAGMCKTCPPTIEEHGVVTHLVDQTWVDDVTSEFGEDSPFVEARVYARFPKSGVNKVIPLSWTEMAVDNEEPTDSDHIRLGVDVASDGGDEFVIAWADGYKCSIRHNSSGAVNENSVDVAGVILDHIREAEAIHTQRNCRGKVRVKIDAIGVGWGVVSTLQRWKEEGRHKSDIIAVKVGERASDGNKFANQRAEMWWNGRTLLQPKKTEDGMKQEIRLDVDRKVLAQLSAPQYKSDSSGRIQIEKKTEMKKRGVTSPDRAEAILLALFEPHNSRNTDPVVPISLGQSNTWGL
jgi:hypothetical protein